MKDDVSRMEERLDFWLWAFLVVVAVLPVVALFPCELLPLDWRASLTIVAVAVVVNAFILVLCLGSLAGELMREWQSRVLIEGFLKRRGVRNVPTSKEFERCFPLFRNVYIVYFLQRCLLIEVCVMMLVRLLAWVSC